MTAYYNEIDKYAAEWLRNLIAAGHIAPGVVDTRDIRDVKPHELERFTQCHFFAGIGVWSYALRRAGWPDDRPIWTGSCPCQPFSAAGRGAGFADERHLWPAWFHLIRECRPAVVFGEQVSAGIRHGWIDLVRADLEAQGYACGHCVFGAHSVGAPHIRQRLFFVADCDQRGSSSERQRDAGGVVSARSREESAGDKSSVCATSCGAISELADAVRSGSLPGPHAGVHSRESGTGSRYGELERPGAACGLADDASSGRREERADVTGRAAGDRAQGIAAGSFDGGSDLRPGPTNGLWRAADWLLCRDGRWRPVEPGTFPLAHGVAGRVGRLRAYGNAIVADQAEAVIRAFDDVRLAP